MNGRNRRARYAAIACLAVLAGGGYYAREQGVFLPPYERAVLPLVKAVGERRFFEPRLTGGFKYGPLVSAKRGGAAAPAVDGPRPTARGPLGPAAEDWAILAAAAEIKTAASTSADGASGRALAASHLMLGQSGNAIALMEQYVLEHDDSAPRSDLAAAYIVDAKDGNPESWLRALAHVDRALTLSPDMNEGLFNRAVILEGLALPRQAARAWERYLALADSDAWTEDAQERLRALQAPQPLAVLPGAQLRMALARGDQRTVDEIAAGSPAQALSQLEELLAEESLGETAWRTSVRAVSLALGRAPARVSLLPDTPGASAIGSYRRYGLARKAYKALDWSLALRLFSEVERDPGLPRALRAWARFYAAALRFQVGALEEADAALRVTLDHSEEDRILLGRASWVRGMIAEKRGRFDAALASYATARRAFDEGANEAEGAFVALLAGDLCDKLGLNRETWRYVLEALTNRSGLERLQQATVLARAAELASASGFHGAAAALAEEAQTSVSKDDLSGDRVAIATGLARVAMASNPQSARVYFGAARRLADVESDPILRRQLLDSLEQLDVEQKFLERDPEFEESATVRLLNDAREVDVPRLLTLRGQWRVARGVNPEGGAHDLLQAIAGFEANTAPDDVARGSYHGIAWSAFEQLIDFYAARGRHQEAIAIAERSLRFSRGEAIGELPEPEDIVALAARQPPYAATILLVPTSTGLHRWTVFAGTTVYQRGAMPREALLDHASAFVRALQTGASQPVIRALGDSLYRSLLGDCLQAIPDATEIAIIPHGLLSAIPYHALWDSSHEQYFGIARPLLVGTTLLKRSQPETLRDPLVSVILGSSSSLPPLPSAREEVARIRRMYPKSVLLFGNAATPAAVRAAFANSDLVHFSGHSAPDADGVPALIVSAMGVGNVLMDGSNVAAEGPVRTRLVVLASCRSMAGDGFERRGAVGVSTRLLRAGVKGVLGTLWEVEDRAASVVVLAFHQAILHRERPVIAMQQARRAAVESGLAPAQWAPFVLVT